LRAWGEGLDGGRLPFATICRGTGRRALVSQSWGFSFSRRLQFSSFSSFFFFFFFFFSPPFILFPPSDSSERCSSFAFPSFSPAVLPVLLIWFLAFCYFLFGKPHHRCACPPPCTTPLAGSSSASSIHPPAVSVGFMIYYEHAVPHGSR
jgi:hypothetical protein